jgi:hypothetical protein
MRASPQNSMPSGGLSCRVFGSYSSAIARLFPPARANAPASRIQLRASTFTPSATESLGYTTI